MKQAESLEYTDGSISFVPFFNTDIQVNTTKSVYTVITAEKL